MMASKKKLSSKLSQMKFMQRREETDTRKKLEAEREKAMRESQWVATGLGTETYIVQDDNRGQRKFTPGRRSFGNFNPVMEKLVKEIKQDIESEEAEGDAITDEQMAQAMSNQYSGLPGKGRPKRKNKEKNNKSNKVVKQEHQDDVKSSTKKLNSSTKKSNGDGDDDVRARAAAFLSGLAPPRGFKKPINPPV